MVELLPCPFCGGEADVMLSQSRWGQSYTIHHAACGKCPAEYVGSMQFVTEAEAIAAWNTRAPVEHDGWFYLPKPKENIAQYGEKRIEKTEHGYKVTQPVEVIEGAIRSWGDELGEYIMKRICEAWDTRAHGTLTADDIRGLIERHSDESSGNGRDFHNGAYVAIADELNARAERTCEWTLKERWPNRTGDDHVYGYETGCGVRHTWWPDSLPKFCPTCGGKVKVVVK